MMETLRGDWGDWAAISITDPECAHGRLKLPGKFIHALNLAFHDADPRNKEQSGENLVYFSEADARAIVVFVRSVEPVVPGIIVNCHDGESRSAAITKWIAGKYRVPYHSHYSRFNKHVYETLVRIGKEMRR